MVEKAFKTNGDGAGVAWREGGVVKWKKGLDLEEVKEMCATLPIPFVAHFRIASVGGARPILCHPFLVNEAADNAMEGETKGYVLFHNGHWGTWKKELWEAAKYLPARIPSGYWSDTRALAWMAYNYGLGALTMIDEKVVAFGPTDMEIVAGTGWSEIEKIWVSNTYFNNAKVDWHDTQHSQAYRGGVYTPTMCRDKRCSRRDIDTDGFCPDHKRSDIGKIRTAEEILESVKGAKRKTGGSSDEDPFVYLARMEDAFKLGTVSKKQLKKARKAADKAAEGLDPKKLKYGKTYAKVTAH